MYKVIIADDNSLSIKGLQTNLNFSMLHAENVGSFLIGMDVIAYLREHADVDVLISDIRMPHMTGLELAREALKINPFIKIILISAYDDFEYAQEALRIGVFDYVQKPINYEDLTTILQRALQKLEDERLLYKRLEEAKPQLIEKFYSDLLHTPPMLAETSLHPQAEYLKINVQHGTFLCVAITVDTQETENGAQGIAQSMLQILGHMENLRSSFSEQFDCRMVSDRDYLFAILNTQAVEDTSLVLQINEFCQRKTKYEDRFRVCFGIGPAVDCLWKIVYSMDAAVSAINRRYIYSDETVFIESSQDEKLAGSFTRISETESEIVKLLLRRDLESLNKLTAMLIHSLHPDVGDGMRSISFLYVLVTGILNRFDGFHIEQASKLLLSFGAKARHNHGSKEIEGFLTEVFALIVIELNKSQQNHQQQLIANIKEYILTHLHDPQLRLESIANFGHVNASHLSRIFKKEENVNISDYITDKRITLAQRLLLTTSDSISDVSEQAGYASPYYFSACFKKLTNVTPSEYRKLNAPQQSRHSQTIS